MAEFIDQTNERLELPNLPAAKAGHSLDLDANTAPPPMALSKVAEDSRAVYERPGIDESEWMPSYEHEPLDSPAVRQPAPPYQKEFAAVPANDGDPTSESSLAFDVTDTASPTLESRSSGEQTYQPATTEPTAHAQKLAEVKRYVDHEIRAGRWWLLDRDYIDAGVRSMINEITGGDLAGYADYVENTQDSSGEIDGQLAPKLEDMRRVVNGTLAPEAMRNFKTLERAALALPAVKMTVETSDETTSTTWNFRTDNADYARTFQAHTLWVPSDIVPDDQLVREPYPYVNGHRQYYPHYLVGARLLEHDPKMTALMALPAAEDNPEGRPGYTSIPRGLPRVLVTRTDIAEALAEKLTADFNRGYSDAELEELREGEYLKISAKSPRSYYVTRQIHKGPSGLDERRIGVSPWRFYNDSFNRSVPEEYMAAFNVNRFLSTLALRFGL